MCEQCSFVRRGYDRTSPVAHEIKSNKLLYVKNRNNKKWSSLRRTSSTSVCEKQPLLCCSSSYIDRNFRISQQDVSDLFLQILRVHTAYKKKIYIQYFKIVSNNLLYFGFYNDILLFTHFYETHFLCFTKNYEDV